MVANLRLTHLRPPIPDAHLTRLALRAQHYWGTHEGKTCLMEFWQAVYRLYQAGQLSRPPAYSRISNYDDVYHDAVSHLMDYVLQHLDRYDPQKASVRGWLNMLLDRRFFRDAQRKDRLREQRIRRPTLAELEQMDGYAAFDINHLPAPEPCPPRAALIQQCFIEDPGSAMQLDTMSAYPYVNFRAIALRYHLDGQSFRDIAADLQVPYTSLVSFYQRHLKQFAPMIRAYVEDQL